MAQEKILDMTKSAAANETAVNNKFEELSNQQTTPSAGGDVSDLAGECVDLNVTWTNGYRIDGNNGSLVADRSAYLTNEIESSGRVGKFLFMPSGKSTWDALYRRYHKDDGDIVVDDAIPISRYGDNPCVIIPIVDENEFFQIKTQGNASAKVYLVTKRWLTCRGLCTSWAGKKWLMYGDSYIGGYTLGTPKNTWHNLFSIEHYARYYNKGYNGIGLVRAKNVADNLISLRDTWLMSNGEPLDVDVLGVTIGRNDYSAGVPIGTIDDMVDPTVQSWSSSATFMGGLNFLCEWLIDNYLGKHIFFITPWYFLDNMPNTVADPVEYVDAVLTVTGKWGIPCFDAARQSGISVQSEAFRTQYFGSVDDTSHLNVDGHRLMAHGPVAGWLENLFRE